MKIFILIVALIVAVNAKVYSKCELAKILKSKGIAVSKLPDWLCLIKHESNYNSRAKGGPNSNGSYDWGLFQINDKYWCKRGTGNGGDCNINCSSEFFS